MVMLAVNNEWLCNVLQPPPPPMTPPPPTSPCKDMDAVDAQLKAARTLEAAVDSVSGGPGKGWYRIVATPSEAAAAISAGKLAVVLGIEVDHLFGSYLDATMSPHDVDDAVQRYYDLGVRHVFPIHFADNLFGGTAFQNGLQGDGVAFTISVPGKTVSSPYVLQTQDGTSLGYEYKGGRQNVRGLTTLGTTLIQSLMKRGMLFDVDHMSYLSRSAVLDIAERMNYPVVSGHSGYIDVCRGDKRHEGQLTRLEVARIRVLVGM